LRGYKELGIHPPIWCFLTLTGVKGTAIGRAAGFARSYPVDRDILYLPEALIDDLSTDTLTVLKPLLNMVWNASGLDQSPNFVESESDRKR
jgi:hypothetical protein